MDRTRPPRADAAAPRPLRADQSMGFVDSLRAKLPGGKDDGKPKKKTAKEIFAEAQKARKGENPSPAARASAARSCPISRPCPAKTRIL